MKVVTITNSHIDQLAQNADMVRLLPELKLVAKGCCSKRNPPYITVKQALTGVRVDKRRKLLDFLKIERARVIFKPPGRKRNVKLIIE